VLVSLSEHWNGLTLFVNDSRVPMDNNYGEENRFSVPSTYAEGVRAIIGLNYPNICYDAFNHCERQNQKMALSPIRSRQGGWHRLGTAKIHELVEVSPVAEYICNEGDRWLAPFHCASSQSALLTVAINWVAQLTKAIT
jgi:hypothetical protein